MELHKKIYFGTQLDFIPAAYYIANKDHAIRENERLKQLIELSKTCFLTLPQKIALKGRKQCR